MTRNIHKIMRTIRVRNDNVPGTLGHLLVSIGEQGGDIGEIRLVQESHRASVRDVTVFADNEAQVEAILHAVEANPGSRVLSVRDEVLELHDKGKIAIRSRCAVDSLDILRRVYTPGVAEVCLMIANDPALAREDFVPYID